MDLAHGQERHRMHVDITNTVRDHILKLSQLVTLARLRSPETKLFDKCLFVSSNTRLPLVLDTPFCSSYSGW